MVPQTNTRRQKTVHHRGSSNIQLMTTSNQLHINKRPSEIYNPSTPRHTNAPTNIITLSHATTHHSHAHTLLVHFRLCSWLFLTHSWIAWCDEVPEISELPNFGGSVLACPDSHVQQRIGDSVLETQHEKHHERPKAPKKTILRPCSRTRDGITRDRNLKN